MLMKYRGSLPEGSIDDAGASWNFKRGETVTLPDSLADRLLKNLPDDWEAVTEPKKIKGGK